MKAKKISVRTAALFAVIAALLIGGVAMSQTLADARDQGLLLIKQVLSPRQFKVVADFLAAHRQEQKDDLAKARGQMDYFAALGDEFNLSDDQEEALAVIAESRLNSLPPLIEALLADEEAIVAAVLAENPDAEAVRAAGARTGQDIADAAVLAAAVIREARSVLTPAQLAIIKEVQALGEKECREGLQKSPAELKEAVTLARDLNLRPEQARGLVGLVDLGKNLFDLRRRSEERQLEIQLKRILARDQYDRLLSFKQAEEQEAEAKFQDYREIGLAFWDELGLSQAQMNQLIDLADSRLGDVNIVVEQVSESALALEAEVLADEPAEPRIRAAADQVGAAIGQAAGLAAQAAGEARSILTPEQFNTILNLKNFIQEEIRTEARQIPARLSGLLQLRRDLALTPEQKAALKALGDNYRKKMQSELKTLEVLL